MENLGKKLQSGKVSEITGAVKHTIYKLNVQPTFVTSTIPFFPGIPPPYHVLGEAMRREEDMILLQLVYELFLGDEGLSVYLSHPP